MRDLLVLLDNFKAENIKFRSLCDGIATDRCYVRGGAMVQAMVTIISAFGQFERGQLSERTKADMERRRLPRTGGRTSLSVREGEFSGGAGGAVRARFRSSRLCRHQ